MRLVVVANHDPNVAKSRVHPDFHPDDESAAVDHRVRLVRLGARRTIISQGTLPWGLLTDPDGDSRLFLHARSIVRAKNEPATGQS
ncbi:VOC family protein [Pengzhenrongella phosphoraccumulans]|uniref:VOC family protein n=1 Tax=Pengzhenrongella phosphoraccumulans TaxID=3114394 RepID=UPI00388D89B6